MLSPALSVTLRDMHAAPLIVGRHGFDMVLDKSLPSCGDQAGIDYEALLSTRPTHVLIEWGSRPLPARLTELSKDRGFEVSTFNTLTLDDIRSGAQALEKTFGGFIGPSEAPLPSVRMSKAWTKREGDLARAGRVLILYSTKPPTALGPGSAHHQVLEAIGGVGAVTSGSPFMELDHEDVLDLKPDAIVIVSPSSPDLPARDTYARVLPAEERARVLAGLATLDIPAVSSGRVALFDDPLVALPSSSLIRFADDLARVLGQWAGESGANSGEKP